ncbi:helix-turn-helix domain-containing protein [Methylicorpusculum sp.]|uniref:helix-turn-helix domain-containing protein n=1 Tax=Methylicorpusculum sp. TaxID=2713644 RepID=UPI002725BF71|nr:helix-turn-helix domain-containing protein [Methylicorpusculum sp.]MDO8844117.1 helix-turn-helix domain-containing protein [Methylicorpusculum sp.]
MNQKSNEDPLLTRREAAKYLGIAEKTLATWASTGRQNLSMIRMGSCVRYRKSDLDQFITQNKV